MTEGGSVRVYVASLNTAPATELCIRSMVQFAEYPLAVTVGDCGSTDRSLRMLGQLEEQGWLKLEVVKGRQHAVWLDDWLARCSEDYAVFVDSDVEFRKRGWLRQLVEVAVEQDAAIVGAEFLDERPEYPVPKFLTTVKGAEVPNFVLPEGVTNVRLAARPAPWLLLVDVPKVRACGASFAVQTEVCTGNIVGFDVGGKVFREAQRAHLNCVMMPSLYRASYHHYGGLSWLPLTGRRGLRKRQALIEVQLRLWWIRWRTRFASGS